MGADLNAIDDVYESIRAPKFFDFCAAEPATQLDTWFASKDEESSEETEGDVTSFAPKKLLPDEEFDSRTPPKLKSRPQPRPPARSISSISKPKVTRPSTATARQSTAGSSTRAVQMLQRQKNIAARLQERRKASQVPRVAQKPATAAKRSLAPARTSIRPTTQTNKARVSVALHQKRQASLAPSRKATAKATDSAAKKANDEQFIFRARPLNRRVLESCGDRGVPKIAKLPLTKPISPKLSTSNRTRTKLSRPSSAVDANERPTRGPSLKKRPATKVVNKEAAPKSRVVMTKKMKGPMNRSNEDQENCVQAKASTAGKGKRPARALAAL